jgi:hypothetical protein
MTAFRRVEDRLAGPRALGILVPPGLRTFVILRPRALVWDLLPLKPEDTSGFCQFGRDEAAGLARRLKQSLEEAACAGQRSSATVLAHSGGFLACFAAQDLHWVVCRRIPGTPYRPLVFSSREEAQRALERLLPFVCPAADAGQEYYFNTQNFVAES